VSFTSSRIGFNDPFPDRLPFDIAAGKALVRTLRGDDGGVAALPLHQEIGGAPEVEIVDAHRARGGACSRCMINKSNEGGSVTPRRVRLACA
jgi:hypothetical protein